MKRGANRYETQTGEDGDNGAKRRQHENINMATTEES